MGCSNPHPHCQIWASSYLPNEPTVKERTQREYYLKHKSPMLCDYVSKELVKKVLQTVNSLPNDKILDWCKLKAFADDKMNVDEKQRVGLRGVESIVGKGENAGH